MTRIVIEINVIPADEKSVLKQVEHFLMNLRYSIHATNKTDYSIERNLDTDTPSVL